VTISRMPTTPCRMVYETGVANPKMIRQRPHAVPVPLVEQRERADTIDLHGR